MANLKETRNRISSIKSTMQITSAMKMVSAAKLKRAQDAITKMRPYAEKLHEILGNLSASSEESADSVYAVTRPVKKVLIIPFSSNKGLCGGFNAQVSKAAFQAISNQYKDKEISVLAVGKKAGEWLKNRQIPIAQVETEIFNDVNFQNASQIAQTVMDSFVEGTYDEVVLVYNKFVNAAVQNVQLEQWLPVVPTEAEENVNPTDYIYEPEKEEIIKTLIPKALKTQFYKALLETIAGEHGARMTAMHQATDNADELRKDLTLKYNQARQAAITTQILEIVGGAEALDN